MLTGLEIMLKRMETHPEEFVGVQGGCSKEWYAVITPAIPHLTEEETEALKLALRKAYRDHLTTQVMKKIAGEEVMSDRERTYLSEDYYGRSLPELLRKNQEEVTATLGAGVTLKNAVHPMPIKGSVLRAAQTTTIGSNGTTQPSPFGAVPAKAEGQAVEYQYRWQSIK